MRRRDTRQIEIPMPPQPARKRDVTVRQQNAIVFLRHRGARIYRADDEHVLVNGARRPNWWILKAARQMGWRYPWKFTRPGPPLTITDDHARALLAEIAAHVTGHGINPQA